MRIAPVANAQTTGMVSKDYFNANSPSGQSPGALRTINA